MTLILLTLAACSTTTLVEREGPELLAPVGFAEMQIFTDFVTRGTVQQVHTFSGQVRVQWETLHFEQVGVIYAVYVTPGQWVYEGQLLARLDTSHLEERITQAQDRVANLLRSRDMAQELFLLDMALHQITQRDAMNAAAENFDEVAMAAAQAMGANRALYELHHRHAMEARETDIAEARVALYDLQQELLLWQLRAPADGYVSLSHMLAGLHSHTVMSVTGVGGTVVFVDRPGILFSPKDEIFVCMAPLQLHIAYLRATRTYAYIEGTRFPARFIYRHDELEMGLRRFQGLPHYNHFYIYPVNGQYPPMGAYVTMWFYTVYVEDVLRLPSPAIFPTIGGGSHAYRLENGVFVQTPVRLATQSSHMYAIVTGGLEEGDEVLVR